MLSALPGKFPILPGIFPNALQIGVMIAYNCKREERQKPDVSFGIGDFLRSTTLDFFAWCDQKNLSIDDLEPIVIAAYVEHLGTVYTKPTVKQHLAAIRMCLDWLVVGQVILMNPSSSVRGPKYVIKKGKTPVLTADEAPQLLDSIDVSTVNGLRDRALVAVMLLPLLESAPLWA